MINSFLDIERGIEEESHIGLKPPVQKRPAQAFKEKQDFGVSITDSLLEELSKPGKKFDPVEGYSCCKKAKPCKHWIWDGTTQAYVNSLTGEVKPSEL